MSAINRLLAMEDGIYTPLGAHFLQALKQHIEQTGD